MTAGFLLAEVAQLFADKGLEQYRREAMLLVADITGTPVGAPVVHPDQPVTPDEVARARHAAARRIVGVPLSYATGVAAFRALTLCVDSRVLIPRPETEGLIDRVLAHQVASGSGGTVVDVCTGSGCIALSLATEGTFARVVGTDCSPAALAVAQLNHARVGPRVPVAWMAGDLLAPLTDRRVDVVVSNPPYVSAAEWDALDAGVRDHEPREALVAGGDGMAVIARLLPQAHVSLVPGGLLAVEVDSQRADAAFRLAVSAGFAGARIEADLFGRPRYLLANKE